MISQERGINDDQAGDKQVFHRIIDMLRPYRGSISILWFTIMIEACLGAAAPFMYKSIIDAALAGRVHSIEVAAGVLVLLAVGSAASSLATRWLSSRIVETFSSDLRQAMFRRVNSMSMSYFVRTRKGDLVSRFNAEIMGAEQSVSGMVFDASSQIVNVVFVFCAMMLMSPLITGVALVLAPLFLLPANHIGRRLRVVAEERYEQVGLMNQFILERFSVSGALLTRTLGWPDADERVFGRESRKLARLGVVQALYSRSIYVALVLLAAVATALVYGLGGVLAASQRIEIGTIVALAAYLQRLYAPLTSLSNIRVDLLLGVASFRRIFEVLDLRPDVVEHPRCVAVSKVVQQGPMVELDRVMFRYPDRDGDVVHRPDRGITPSWRLENISFSVERGQTVAVVGPSGAGKSTLASLICRQYDVSKGAVMINGNDVRSFSLASLRMTVALITQRTHMFQESIRDNLLLANPGADDHLMWESLRLAKLDGLVSLMPSGLDTVVGDGGLNFSGGEQQRFAIARLALRNPSLVVLDEPMAHLDVSSEATMQEALRAFLKGRTTVLIAHRLSTVREADCIVVLEQGRLTDMGTHLELLARPGYYSRAFKRFSV